MQIETSISFTVGSEHSLCAACGCSVRGALVRVTHEHNTVLGRALPTYWHATPADCTAARARSAAFWAQPREVSHADA